jgi:hypothetical protein
MYWKFRDFYEGNETPPPVAKVPVTKEPEPKLDLPAKETPTVQVNSTEALEESEAVKNFRAKYGTASEPIASQ